MGLPEILGVVLLKPSAYLDPGSGSFILQMLIAGVLGIGLAFRSYWWRLYNKLRNGFAKNIDEEQSEDEAD